MTSPSEEPKIHAPSFVLGMITGSALTLVAAAAAPAGVVAVATSFGQTFFTGASMFCGFEASRRTIAAVDQALVKQQLKRA